MASPHLRATVAPSAAPQQGIELLGVRVGEALSLGIPVRQTRQVLQIPKETILPIPDMPDAVLGVCRFQGKLLWLVDLATLFKINPGGAWETKTHATVVTLELIFEGQPRGLGLVIEHLEDILEVSSTEIAPASGEPIPDVLKPYIRSLWPRSAAGGSLWILDGLSILRALKPPASS
ncbi:MAG: chemotaxis protein CheW [Thermostichus sp. HHBFW_bins_43]